MKLPIAVTTPSITEKEIAYVTQAVTHAWKAQANIFHDKFEHQISSYLGVQHAIATSSCTGALHLALKTLGVQENDEVIVPDITWTATAAAVTYLGAIPVFADIDSISWCVTAETIRKKITPKTRVIIVVDLYGNIPNFNAIRALANEYNLPILEDAAQAIGAEYYGKKAGSLGDIGVFSFHGTKTLTTGEGGMLVTNNTHLFERALFLSDHGRAKTDRSFWNTEIGYKYKMSCMQAALGLAQLERIDELVDKKIQNFAWYKNELQHIPQLQLNPEENYIKNTFWMSTIIIKKSLSITKEAFQKALKNHLIDTRPFFYPLSMMPAYKLYTLNRNYAEENPVSYNIHTQGINLPSGHELSHEEVKFICEKVQKVLNEYAYPIESSKEAVAHL